MSDDKEIQYYCSFCGKDSTEVLLLIAAQTAFICDECVDLLSKMVADKRAALKEDSSDPTT